MAPPVVSADENIGQYLYDYKIYKEYVAILSAFDVASARLDEELREREQVLRLTALAWRRLHCFEQEPAPLMSS